MEFYTPLKSEGLKLYPKLHTVITCSLKVDQCPGPNPPFASCQTKLRTEWKLSLFFSIKPIASRQHEYGTSGSGALFVGLWTIEGARVVLWKDGQTCWRICTSPFFLRGRALLVKRCHKFIMQIHKCFTIKGRQEGPVRTKLVRKPWAGCDLHGSRASPSTKNCSGRFIWYGLAQNVADTQFSF